MSFYSGGQLAITTGGASGEAQPQWNCLCDVFGLSTDEELTKMVDKMTEHFEKGAKFSVSQTQTLRKMLVVLAWSCYADADDIPPGESSLPKTSAHYIACEQVPAAVILLSRTHCPGSWTKSKLKCSGASGDCIMPNCRRGSRWMEKLVMSRQHRS